MTNQEAIEKFEKIKRGNIYLIHQRVEGKEVFDDYSLCDMAISALQAQDVHDTNDGNMISRQVAIRIAEQGQIHGFPWQFEQLTKLSSVQPEPSIPISWIEKQIDWLKSMDNEFSDITAMNISALVKKWRKENGKDDGSD